MEDLLTDEIDEYEFDSDVESDSVDDLDFWNIYFSSMKGCFTELCF
jgi:hypothetical protein